MQSFLGMADVKPVLMLFCVKASDAPHHVRYQTGRVMCRSFFKNRIFHLSAVVGLIRNCPDNHKGYVIQIRTVGYGGALHFRTVAVKF